MGNVISLDALIKRVCDGVLAFGYEFAVKYAAYVYNLQDNLQSLEKSLEDLRTLKKELIRRISVKQGYRMQTGEKVDLWITRVEKEIAKGDELVKEGDRQVDSLCLGGICSTSYVSSSIFGGQVDKCGKELNALKTTGDGFTDEDLIVEAAPELNRGVEKPCGPTVGLDAKLDEVLSHLEQENVGIVGVYGQGGIGKTTLLKKINNHFVRESDFLVIWIDVPKDVNLESIQQAIGEKIGLPDELKGSSLEEKAAYIFMVLQQKKVVLLLDDIRRVINLSKIGIPPSERLNESKVVFTTRPEHVCKKMEPQPDSSVSIATLTEEQAWQLFVMKVGEDTINSHPQIQQLARIVAKKCGGLPLALAIIGKAMSCDREPKVWEHTIKTFERQSLQRTKHHQEADEDSMGELFSILRYSYDNLPNEIYRSCFLYFALCPDASRILKTNIVEWWMFEDFWIDFDDDDEIDPRYEAYRILNVLVGACLIEYEKDSVKMHDVVRSMALWIGKRDILSMAGMDLKEAPSVRTWKQKKRVSLMFNDVEELTQVPACPDLVTLNLRNNDRLYEICNGFFESMSKLTVLDLSYTSVKELPESISRLFSLRYLDISFTKIRQLPVALTNLKELRYLNVNGVTLFLCRTNQVICNLSSLQILKMRCAYYYEEEGDDNGEEEEDAILLEELQVLENLNVFEIQLQSFSGLLKLFNTRRLLERTQSLSLSSFEAPECMDISFLAQAKRLDSFIVCGCDFSEMYIDSNESSSNTSKLLRIRSPANLTQIISFNSITIVAVVRCSYVEELTCLSSMLNLRRLTVYRCERLREIISTTTRGKLAEVKDIGNGEEVVRPIFSSLAVLRLEDLPVLKSIYPTNTLTLQFLYEFTVKNCPQLKKLPFELNSSRSVLGCQIELHAEEDWWDAIEWEDVAVATTALSSRFQLYLS